MKRMKRIFAGCLILTMVMITSAAPTFAGIMDEVGKTNSMAMVMVENANCEMLPELDDLTVHISSKEAGIDIQIPVDKITEDEDFLCMWLGVPSEKISDEMMKKLAEIQGKVDLQDVGETLDDLNNLLNKFQVQVKGLPEDHYVATGGALVITNEIYKQAIDILRQALKENGMEFESFSELIEKLLADADLTLDDIFDTSDMTEEDWADLEKIGFTKEDLALLKDMIINIDQVIDYLCSEDFTGVLIAGVYLTCDCPELTEYQIQHRYYERQNGKLKLVGVSHEGEYDAEFEEYYLTGETGTVIRAKDFRKTNYKGKSYDYMGSYDDIALYDGWKHHEMKSFVLGEDLVNGLVLRYVIDKGDSPAINGTDGENDLNHGGAPQTGDNTPLGIYIALFVAAAAATGAAVVYKKKRK